MGSSWGLLILVIIFVVLIGLLGLSLLARSIPGDL